MKKGCGLMRGFVPDKGRVEVLDSKVNGEEEELGWSHLTLTSSLDLS